MNKKFILSSVVILLVILVVSTSNVFAMDTASNSGTLKIGSPSAKRLEITTANMDKAKSRATAEIDRRLASLNKVLERLNSFKHLSSDQRPVLTANVQEQIDSLTALRAKISADTDVATLKIDIQSIRDSYRIYAFFIPQIHLLAAADAMIEATNKGTEIASMLETKISQAQSSGQDVASLLTILSDMRTNIDGAKTQAQNVQSAVTPLTAEGYPGNKATLQEARTNLRSGRGNLEIARSDARTIRDSLRSGQIPKATINTQLSSPSAAATSSANR